MMSHSKYPDLMKFAKSIGMRPEHLINAYELEKAFHEQILQESSFEKRKSVYAKIYNTVHPIYRDTTSSNQQKKTTNDPLVTLFRKELEGNTILDVGCGQGRFLETVSRLYKHKALVGIDVSLPSRIEEHAGIQFISADIIKFEFSRKFDVVFSNQVLEHIAPVDLSTHLESVNSALRNGGTFIINLPNRLFGPSDVTRIIDFSYTGKTMAQGTHLNESTYSELIPILKQHGFVEFRTVLPLPKLKYLFKNFRMRPSLLVAIERSTSMLNIVRFFRFKGQCIAKFGITLICTKRSPASGISDPR